ncbi:MAG: hypothetical protein JW913_20490 [Chitinispirillaceae bacterium]|nr:hypothetical protein [Chitinispirillaceae bacterium]
MPHNVGFVKTMEPAGEFNGFAAPSVIVMLICILSAAALFPIYGSAIEIRPFTTAAPLMVPLSCAEKNWMEWPDSGNRDSLTRDLLFAVKNFRQSTPSAGNRLTEAVCWHLLHRMGVDSGSAVSNRILRSLERSGHHLPEMTWLYGLNCVWSGKMRKGISILDSIRLAAHSDDPSFSDEFLRFALRCFIPSGCEQTLSTIVLPSSTLRRTSAPTYQEEAFPERLGASLYKSYNGGRFPSFCLSAGFELTPLPSLHFSFPPEPVDPHLPLNLDSLIADDLPQPRVPDPFSIKLPMEMKIVAMPGDVQISLVEYISSFIDDRFHLIWSSRDLERFNAVSVRCREQSVFRDVAGKYYAFVAFDARVFSKKGRIRFEPAKGAIGREEIPVRYLLVLRSRQNIEDKAEQLLQNILLAFDAGGG